MENFLKNRKKLYYDLESIQPKAIQEKFVHKEKNKSTEKSYVVLGECVRLKNGSKIGEIGENPSSSGKKEHFSTVYRTLIKIEGS